MTRKDNIEIDTGNTLLVLTDEAQARLQQDTEGELGLDFGVRSILTDGHVELVLVDKDDIGNELGSLYIDTNGGAYNPGHDSAIEETIDRIHQTLDRYGQ